MTQIQVVIRDMPASPALENHIRKRAEKLNHYCQRINLCKILVEIPQKHKRQGRLFNVRIDITVPGKELVVNRKLNEDVYVAIRDAFKALERQLECYAKKKRGEVKSHDNMIRGYVKKLFSDEGYGFIQGADGNEFYFSATNVAYPQFGQLSIGDIVEFKGIPANEGLQANRVTMERQYSLSQEK